MKNEPEIVKILREEEPESKSQNNTDEASCEFIASKESSDVLSDKAMTIIDFAAVFILGFDKNGNIIFLNREVEKKTGFHRNELFNKSITMLLPSSKPKINEFLNGLSSEELVLVDFECPLQKKNNEEIIGSWQSSIIKDENGNLICIMLFGVDITRQKQAEEALRVKNYAIASSINAIVITDLEGNITHVNRSFLQTWGYKDEKEVVGKPLVKFWRAKGKTVEVMDALFDKGFWVGELTAEREIGSTFPVQLSANLVTDEADEPICMMASFVDITERKLAEEEIKKSRREIELQNIQLKKLDRIKSDFLNVTSHELRTPMAAIKGYIQMILKQTLGTVTPEQKNALDVVLRNTDRLDHLIQDILDISRLESGTMKFIPEKTDIKTLVGETVETMQSSADLKHIKINADIEDNIPKLTIDQERIKQVFINLVNNAIKFSPDKSIINIRAKKEEDNILFELQDFGRGIPKNKQQKIFETFYQVDSGMDRKFGGAGLGLAISRGIVLAHGGKIWVESTVDEGSTFRFTLPITPVRNVEARFKEIDVFKLETEKEDTASQSKIQSNNEDLKIPGKPSDEDTSKSNGYIHTDIQRTIKNIDLGNLEEIYQTVFENSAVAITLTDENENIIYWNEYAEDLLGMNRSDLFMKPVKSLYPVEEWKKIRSENVRQKGMQHHLETKILCKDNKLLDVDISLSVLKNLEGKIVGTIGIIKDISDRKQAEQKLSSLLKYTDDSIYLVDRDCRYILVNDELALRLDLPNEKIVGKTFDKLHSPEETKDFSEKVQCVFKNNKPVKDEHWKNDRCFLRTLSPVIDHITGQTNAVAVISKDITDLKKTDGKLAVSDEELRVKYDNLKKSLKEIEKQNVELKKLDEIRSAFLNVTSHELRTPMSSIKGYVQMLMKQSLGEITEEQRRGLEVILRNADRLDHLIQDILDISRLESGSMKFIPEKTDIKTLVGETVETMQSSADLKHIKINADIEDNIAELTIDQERIKQVIINLISNAIKFSPDGSIINTRAKKEGDVVLFEVQDFGRGIPKDKQNKIFETFYQVDSSKDTKFGGAGLGLTISRGIVLAHGGQIQVESTPGKGSTFRFTLPVTPVINVEGRFKEIDVFRVEK